MICRSMLKCKAHFSASGVQADELCTLYSNIANPIDNSPGTTILMTKGVYEYCTLQKHSQTPHPTASNIAGTITVAIVPMPIYTTTFVRTNTRQHTNEQTARREKGTTHHRHHNVSPSRPPPYLPHSPQTQQSSPARIPTGTRAA
jgi:hypothetical protein